MFRAQPVISKINDKKRGEKVQQLHETKLRLARSALDSRCSAPKYKHLKLKQKKGQQQEGNFTNLSIF